MPDEPNPTPKVVGRNIRRILDEKHITQVDLARGVEVHPTTLRDYLTGDIDMPVSRLQAIADELDVRPCQLLNGQDEAA